MGLATPGPTGLAYSARELANIYLEDGHRIFSRSVFQRLRSLDGWSDAKYSESGIEELLEERFGETRLSQTLVPVLITGYELEKRIALFFKTRNAHKPGYDFTLKDVAGHLGRPDLL